MVLFQLEWEHLYMRAFVHVYPPSSFLVEMSYDIYLGVYSICKNQSLGYVDINYRKDMWD